MKTSIKTLLCALALGTTIAFAGPGKGSSKPTTFATGIYKTIDGNLSVNIEKKVPAYASVTITNSNGDVLARESIGKKQIKGIIKFDLSSLPDGEYKVAILSKGEKEEQEFTITSVKPVVKRMLTFE